MQTRGRTRRLAEESRQAETWRAPTKADAKEATLALLAKLQDFLSTEEEDSRLAILTREAFPTTPEESPDPVQAALAGLAGSAASEHPGRVCLIDSDGSDASEAILPSALASSEPQLALREGELLVPRLAGERRAGGTGGPLAPWSFARQGGNARGALAACQSRG